MGRKFFFLITLALFMANLSLGQTTFKGTVTEASSGRPLPGVNVYLAETTYGASTDKKGHYEFEAPDKGSFKLVFSYVGYQKKVQDVELPASDTVTTSIEMKQKVENLKEINVTSSNEEWKEQFEIFSNQFIGKTKFADQVTIQNPWVLSFEEQRNKLIATAQEPLKIVNRALGYQIHLELISFAWSKYNDQGGSYKTLPKFEPLTPATEAQQHQWKKNRLQNYLGSFTHFLKSLYQDKVSENNFEINYPGYLSKLSEGKAKYNLMSTRKVSPGEGENLKGYKLSGNIEIEYEHTFQYQFNGESHSISVKKYGKLQSNTRDRYFYIYKNGNLLNPNAVTLYGQWSLNRLANKLPANYSVN